jgi:hypothetical protein
VHRLSNDSDIYEISLIRGCVEFRHANGRGFGHFGCLHDTLSSGNETSINFKLGRHILSTQLIHVYVRLNHVSCTFPHTYQCLFRWRSSGHSQARVLFGDRLRLVHVRTVSSLDRRPPSTDHTGVFRVRTLERRETTPGDTSRTR